MATFLAFQTSSLGPGIHVSPHQVTLGVVDVSPYAQIRVVASLGPSSPSGVTFTLTITEGGLLIAHLDQLQLAPGVAVTNVYEAPGTALTLLAEATSSAGATQFVALIYGSTE